MELVGVQCHGGKNVRINFIHKTRRRLIPLERADSYCSTGKMGLFIVRKHILHEYNRCGKCEVGIVTRCARIVYLTRGKKVLIMTLPDK